MMQKTHKFHYLGNVDPLYVDQLLERYRQDPESIDPTWRYFFDGMEIGNGHAAESNGNGVAQPIYQNGHTVSPTAATQKLSSTDLSSEAKVADLINAYRERGRLIADSNPLENNQHNSHPLLELSNFQLTDTDLDRTFTAGKLIGLPPSKLRDIISRLKEIYCRSIGVEFTHIQDPVAREWLQNKMESSLNREDLDAATQREILQRLTETEAFEQFLHTRYVAQKRFSIEGADALVPTLDRIIREAARLGANNMVMGMAHRGRLNVLTNIYGKKPEHIFSEYEENYDSEGELSSGDVKYHKGYSADIQTPSGQSMHLSLAHNPSHLEWVNPVVEGIARSKQRDLKDKERRMVIPLLIHGDAAFAGQGVVYETLNLSQLNGYWTGGTIHIVIDNQVGFTADPKDTRSTTYCTDVAKMLEVPIFHVNGNDPEALWYVARLCTEYRQRFKKDVIIDIICYRKYGHNEGDEPSFTQPLMYKIIKNMPSPRKIYADRLVQKNILTAQQAQSLWDQQMERLTQAQQITRTEKPKPFTSSYTGKWKDFHSVTETEIFQPIATQLAAAKLIEYQKKLVTYPNNFQPHKKLEKVMEARLQSVLNNKGIDWGTAETLAYASLLDEGHHIRISGQDVERGTFSHRHAVLKDPETGQEFTPLNQIHPDRAEINIYNSSLSEAAVLGFEYGWSLADPSALVIWEAQFGDFANTAQVIIDQFIASGEAKWKRSSGLVMFLPHGHEGQGPEHSSARLERYLQLGAGNNISVCQFTTPAQIYHALRRQIHRKFRVPLIVMTPKSLLRHPKAVSTLSELADGSFQNVLDDSLMSQPVFVNKVKRILFCTGKIYYELLTAREAAGISDMAIVRIEELYPFPYANMEKIIKNYPRAERCAWVQDEPRNQGAWTYIFSYWAGGVFNFHEKVQHLPLLYIGRDIHPTPAVGSHKRHEKEQHAIIQAAMSF